MNWKFEVCVKTVYNSEGSTGFEIKSRHYIK